MSDLLQLAERCEQATDGQMPGLVWEAGAAIFGTDEPADSHSRHAWFVAYAQAEAWTDAAMTLVPEGCEVLDLRHERDRGKCRVSLTVLRALTDYIGNGATPALALCAAALRTRAASELQV